MEWLGKKNIIVIAHLMYSMKSNHTLWIICGNGLGKHIVRTKHDVLVSSLLGYVFFVDRFWVAAKLPLLIFNCPGPSTYRKADRAEPSRDPGRCWKAHWNLEISWVISRKATSGSPLSEPKGTAHGFLAAASNTTGRQNCFLWGGDWTLWHQISSNIIQKPTKSLF